MLIAYATVACAAVVAACSGGGNGAAPVAAPAGSTVTSRLQVSIVVSARTNAAAARGRLYISNGLQSLGVMVGSGALVTAPCTPPPSGTTTCSVSVDAGIGQTQITVTTYATSSPGPTPSAYVLSYANATVAIAPAVLNTPTIVTAPVVRTLTASLANPFPIQGTSASTTLSVSGAVDAAGFTIPGPLSSVAPMTFTGSSNVVSFPSASVTDLTKAIAVNYSGGTSGPVTITASGMAGSSTVATLTPDFFLFAPFEDGSGHPQIGILDRYRPSIFNIETLDPSSTNGTGDSIAVDKAGTVAYVPNTDSLAQVSISNGVPGAVALNPAVRNALVTTNGTQFFASSNSAIGSVTRGPVFSVFFTSSDCGGNITGIATDATGSSVYYAGACSQVFAVTTGGVRTASAANPNNAAYVNLAWFSQGSNTYLIANDAQNAFVDVYALPLNGTGPIAHLPVPVANVFGADFVSISPDQSTAAIGDDLGPIFGDSALYLVDLTNPRAPVIRAKVPAQPFGGYSSGGYSGAGDAIYATACALDGFGAISNLSAPVPTATTLMFPAPFQTESPCSVAVSPQTKLRKLRDARARRVR